MLIEFDVWDGIKETVDDEEAEVNDEMEEWELKPIDEVNEIGHERKWRRSNAIMGRAEGNEDEFDDSARGSADFGYEPEVGGYNFHCDGPMLMGVESELIVEEKTGCEERGDDGEDCKKNTRAVGDDYIWKNELV